jgi:2-keto-3-deoxy-L-rhamnonate aldolase RhmA
MRPNALRCELRGDGLSIGTFLNFPDATLLEFAGRCGFDWILLDAEHEQFGVSECYELVRAADAVGIATVIRVPRNTPDVLLAYAETGAGGVLAPHVDSAEAASALVSALAFPPAGPRRVSPTSRAANYGLTQTPAEYLAAADEHTIPMALLEDDIELSTLDEILEVDGLDVFAIGPGDLAASMGLPGQAGHARVQEKVRATAERLAAAGKTLVYPSAGAADAVTAVALGAKLVVTSTAGLLRGALTEYLEGVRQLGRPASDDAVEATPRPE